MTSQTEPKKKEPRFNSLNEFTILDEIEKGGYSKVYLVENKKTKRQYALKACFRLKKGKDRSERTRTEIKILKKLKHQNIIRLKGWFEDDDNIYLVLEYIRGKDCSKFFRHNLPTKSQVRSIIKQLVETIIFCHSKGIVHRDLKLENVLVDENYNIKLIDFGLAAIKTNQFDMLSGTMGTVRYTSPEMIEGKGYNDSIDVWGIGVILFALLTGSYPFDTSNKENTKQVIFQRICERKIHYSKYNLEKNEVKLLKMLLEKNPEERIEIEHILKQPFFNE